MLTFSSGTATFGNQIVDATTALIAFTYRGDANLSGVVDLDDFTIYAATGNGNPGDWSDADFDYNGIVNLDDFTSIASNFGKSPDLVARSTQSLLQPLYVAMLDHADIFYWGAKLREDIWWRFEEFELLDLGPVPPMPESMRNSIPEPVAGALMGLLALAGSMNRPRRR